MGATSIACYGERSLRQRLSERDRLRQALAEIASLAVWDRNSSGHIAMETYTKIQQIIQEVLR